MMDFHAYARRAIPASGVVGGIDLTCIHGNEVVILPPPACGHCHAILNADVPHSCPGLIEEQRQDRIREAIRTLEREGYRIIAPS
jgi:hypothetical protein